MEAKVPPDAMDIEPTSMPPPPARPSRAPGRDPYWKNLHRTIDIQKTYLLPEAQIIAALRSTMIALVDQQRQVEGTVRAHLDTDACSDQFLATRKLLSDADEHIKDIADIIDQLRRNYRVAITNTVAANLKRAPPDFSLRPNAVGVDIDVPNAAVRTPVEAEYNLTAMKGLSAFT